MYKLIATDLDGTFLDDSHYKQDLTYIEKLRQLNLKQDFLFVSGRISYGIINLVKHLKMDDMIRYIIGFNGAQIYDLKEEKVIFEEAIDEEIANDIIKMLVNKGLKNPIAVQEWDKLYTYNYDERVDLETSVNETICVKIDDISQFPKNKLKIMIFASGNEVDDIHHLIVNSEYGKFIQSARNVDCLVELTKAGINKAHALSKIAEIKNISLNEIIAFGNAENDLEMLQEVKLAYAMKNSDDIVLEKFNNVTKYTNNECGVEKTLLELYKNNTLK